MIYVKIFLICSLFFHKFLLLAQKDVYLFAYFTGRGEDGLHLAYSYDGLKWIAINNNKSILKPQIGEEKLMRDPCIIKGGDGKFHLVWTTGWWNRYIGYANSEDLIKWSDQKLLEVMKHEPDAKNCWAPELYYDTKKKQYLIFWSTTIPGRHKEVPTSESEKGLNHRIYYTITKNFEDFSKPDLFFNPDFSVIDATILKYKGIYYMFVKNENSNPPEKNIRYTTSKNLYGPYNILVSNPITGNYWAEGPTAIKINGYIYVYFDKYREKKYGVVRTKDFKNWEDISNLLEMPLGIRHGSILKIDKNVLQKLLEHFNN